MQVSMQMIFYTKANSRHNFKKYNCADTAREQKMSSMITSDDRKWKVNDSAEIDLSQTCKITSSFIGSSEVRKFLGFGFCLFFRDMGIFFQKFEIFLGGFWDFFRNMRICFWIFPHRILSICLPLGQLDILKVYYMDTVDREVKFRKDFP